MNVLRQVGSVSLNEGTLQAKGLFNLYDEETDDVSLWFDGEEKDLLLHVTDREFLNLAELHFLTEKL
jgi:hypothetical protein